MEKPKHVKFLEFLGQNSISKPILIKDFIIKNFENPPNDDFELIRENDPALLFVEDLYIKKYIYYEKDALLWICEIIPNSEPPVRFWFDDYIVYASITIDGIDYLERYNQSQILIGANRASIRNFYSQVLFSLVTLTIAAVSTFLGILNYKYSKSNDTKLNDLQKRILRIEEYTQPKPIQRKPPSVQLTLKKE